MKKMKRLAIALVCMAVIVCAIPISSAGPLADYGDAPDPTYPSLFSSRGPYHLDVSQEWIGTSTVSTTTVEGDALVPDGDFDDGVILLKKILVGGVPVNGGYVVVPITISGTADNQIRYLNVVADLNQDGNWQAYSLGGGITQQEWIVQNLAIFTEPGTSVNISAPFVLLDTSVIPPDQLWMRATITTEIIDSTIFGLAGWNGTGPVGGFLRGETEDHNVSVEYHTLFPVPPGLIPDPPPGFCGDGILQPWLGEQCEPPNTPVCNANCQLIPPPPAGFCGDGIIQPWLGEQCDPPNGVTCDFNCQNIPQPPDPVPVDGVEKEGVPDITQCSYECAPTSAANSLYFLGKAHGFSDKLPGSPDNPRDLIEELKKRMNWMCGKGVTAANFTKGKKNITKHLKLPIETHCQEASKGQIPTVDFICSELEKCQDVELGMAFDGGGGHMVTVVGYTKYSDGSVKLKIHDPDDKFTGDMNYWMGQRNGGYRSLVNYKDPSGNNLPNRIFIVCAESPIIINLTNLGPEYQEILPGETATYTIRVTNLGSATDTITLKHENISESGSCSWIVVLSKYSVTLAPDTYEDVILSVTSALSCEISSRKKTKVTGTSQNGLDVGVTITDSVVKETHNVPEFTTIAIPVAAILGLLFLFSRRRRKQ